MKAWGWYVAGGVTVLLGLWLYARRLAYDVPAGDELDADSE